MFFCFFLAFVFIFLYTYFFQAGYFLDTSRISLTCHSFHQRNVLCCCAVIFISQSFECAKHQNFKKKWCVSLIYSATFLHEEGSKNQTEETLSMKILCQQMLTHTCQRLRIDEQAIPVMPLEQERCVINTLLRDLKIYCSESVHR